MNDQEITYVTPEPDRDTPLAAAPATPTASAVRPAKPAGIKRAAASLLLAVGLLAVGGAAIVNAASPDPSATAAPAASSAPSTTNPATPGTNGTMPNRANCPNM